MCAVPSKGAAALVRALATTVTLMVAVSVDAAAPAADAVPVELWDRPRSGRAFLGVAAVQRALGELAAKPSSRLTIRHAPGTESSAQAEEIRSWFMAHAIGQERIDLRADLAAREPMRLDVSEPQTR